MQVWQFLTFPFNFPVWPMQKMSSSWIMIMDYCKLNQAMPIVAVVPDVILYLSRLTQAPGIWYTAIDLIFFPLKQFSRITNLLLSTNTGQ